MSTTTTTIKMGFDTIEINLVVPNLRTTVPPYGGTGAVPKHTPTLQTMFNPASVAFGTNIASIRIIIYTVINTNIVNSALLPVLVLNIIKQNC